MQRNFDSITHKLIEFLREHLKSSGLNNLLIGVSGGLDSAVVAALCKLAMPQNTHALLMPTKSSSAQNLRDGIELCENLQINYKIIEIQSILDAYGVAIGENLTSLRAGNLAARIRMGLLYDRSASLDALVVGTSNKSELMLGYGTIFGDLACAINPIGKLYKSEIFEYAKFLGISESIVRKKPSADLWEGQSDEADLGYSYAVLDEVLRMIEILGEDVDRLNAKFDDQTLVQSVLKRVQNNKFKRHMPIVAEI